MVLGCGGDDAGTSGAGGSSGGGGSGGVDDGPSADESDSTADGDGSGGSPEGCGNGVVDSGEECDDGDQNSDTTPDACRTNCRAAQCFDGVVDPGAGEECDDGAANADFEANACRTNCLLPRCGDGGVDTGESCDDGNEAWGDSCFQCSERFYFVLNAPDMAGGGNVSITRTTRDGTPVQLVGDDPSYNGIWQIALEPDGTTVYALQSDGETDRVLLFSGETGALDGEIDIGAGVIGYDPEARGIVRASDGLVYVAVTGNGSVRLLSIDMGTRDVTEAIDFGSTFEIADMAHDQADGIYITTGPGNSIIRADIGAGTTSTFADGADGLVGPIGIAYGGASQQLWVANSPGPTDIIAVDLTGAGALFTTAAEAIGDEVPALAIDTGNVVSAVVPSQDRIVGIGMLGGVQSLFTEAVSTPIDLVILELPKSRD